jgi:transcriptional regulator with XRE-family HTH domain
MTTWSNEIFAANLRHYIKSSGRTQKELAEYVGVSSPTMHDWCKGKKLPRMDKIEKLSNYFGIEKSDLLEDKKRKPIENDGLTEDKRKLIEFAKTVPDDRAAYVLKLLRTIAEGD